MCLTKINNLKAICVINVGPVWRLFWSFNLIFFPCLFSWGSAAIRLWWNLIFLLWGRGVTNMPADALSFHPSSVFTLSDCHSSGRCLKDEQMLNPATIPSLHMLTTQFFPHLCPTTKKQTLFLENQKCCAFTRSAFIVVTPFICSTVSVWCVILLSSLFPLLTAVVSWMDNCLFLVA